MRLFRNIPRKEILYTIIFGVYLSPPFLQTIEIYHRLWQVVCCSLSLFYIVKYLKHPKHIGCFILTVCFYFSILLSTIINHGLILQFGTQTVIGIGFISMVLVVFSSDTCNEALSSFILVLFVYVVVNLVTIICWPDGLYRVYGYNIDWGSNPAYFLGHRNNAIEYFLPLIGLIGVKKKKDKKGNGGQMMVIMVISIITSVITWSINALLCLVFLMFSLVMFNKKGIAGYSIPVFLLLSLIGSFLLVNIGINDSLQNIIVNVFHKTPTMSGRTRIWGKAIPNIKERLIIGHGVQSNEYNYSRITTVSSCHNFYLDCLYWGGIICFFILLASLILLYKKEKCFSIEKRRFVSIFYGAYFILWIATPIHKETMFLMISFFIISYLMLDDEKSSNYFRLDLY